MCCESSEGSVNQSEMEMRQTATLNTNRASVFSVIRRLYGVEIMQLLNGLNRAGAYFKGGPEVDFYPLFRRAE